ncbi:18 kDa heat shock protein [Poriferisphaera corsica]|uniref:18 kDa heat shock protein n=1 Tax=Poriferisphaera corsica TaxID=2528020 RepID=A0A517YWX6_9BACT|nr:Hsp20/alpha crystallin family protein [Poriferisphaera corsica]QDU34738.1 18 kDa heat shock protein [Poriferisphaera corsica]
MLPSIRRTWETPLDTLNRELNRLFGDEHDKPMCFPVDIYEKDNEIVIEAELPGFKRDEIEVTTEQNTLTIKAEHNEEKHEDSDKNKHHISERRYQTLSRSFDFPSTVNSSKVEAHYERGILTLKLPKRGEVHARKIEVK